MMFHISEKPFEKLAGTVCPAPYVVITISSLTGRKSVDIGFKARIDLGADITCIPRNQAEKLMPLSHGKPVLIRGHDGSVTKGWTYLMTVSIHSYPDEEQVKSYRPERGVLLTDSDIGLIGMDIIKYCKLRLDGASQTFSMECTNQ
jgi:hypothetical protein